MPITNPQFATITRVDGTPDVASFTLKYLHAGQTVSSVTAAANYVTANQYVQSLATLNAGVAAQFQGAELVFQASAANVGGASTFVSSVDIAIVINAPAAPADIDLS